MFPFLFLKKDNEWPGENLLLITDELVAMIRENRQLVTDEQVEFEKLPVDVQDCRTITDHFRGTYRIYPSLTKENRRM